MVVCHSSRWGRVPPAEVSFSPVSECVKAAVFRGAHLQVAVSSPGPPVLRLCGSQADGPREQVRTRVLREAPRASPRVGQTGHTTAPSPCLLGVWEENQRAVLTTVAGPSLCPRTSSPLPVDAPPPTREVWGSRADLAPVPAWRSVTVSQSSGLCVLVPKTAVAEGGWGVGLDYYRDGECAM